MSTIYMYTIYFIYLQIIRRYYYKTNPLIKNGFESVFLYDDESMMLVYHPFDCILFYIFY